MTPSQKLQKAMTGRHPSVQHFLPLFSYDHLKGELADLSSTFATQAAMILLFATDDNPEVSVALRKLLESKDAAVRALVIKLQTDA